MFYIKDFQVTTGKTCLISALADILNYYQYDLKEGELFGLCEGQLFYFGGLNGKTEEELVGISLLRELKMGGMKYEINKIFKVIQNILNLNIEGYEFQNKETLQSVIQSHIDRGIPLIAFTLRYYLDYCDDYYLKDKYSHTITVYGYDFEQSLIYVTDTFIATTPVSNYKGTLSLNNFIKALDLSEAVFEMATKECLVAVYPKDKDILTEIPVNILINSLVNTAKSNLRGDIIEYKIHTGINGMKKFSEEFKMWKKIYSDVMLKQILKTVHNLITNYGGPYVTNGFLADYIEKIYKANEQPFYLELKDKFMYIQKCWLIIANMCFKTSLGNIDDAYEKISIYIDQLIEEIESLYLEILKIENINSI